MSAADSIIAVARDPRLSPYATSATPAWAWSQDGSRLLFANASGAAVLGAASPAALAERGFAADDPMLREIARVAATLPENGAPRLAQFAIGSQTLGSETLTCTCSRLAFGEEHVIFIVGSEPMRPALSLAARVERLFAPGSAAVAVFSADGALVYATGDLEAGTTLATLGADALKAAALATGAASGETALGTLTLARLGRGSTTVLVASLPEAAHAPAHADAPEPTAQEPQDGEIHADETPPAVIAPDAPPPAETRPLLTVVPASANVLPFRTATAAEKKPALTPVERSAFHEIAETLGKAAPGAASSGAEAALGEAPPVTPEATPGAAAASPVDAGPEAAPPIAAQPAAPAPEPAAPIVRDEPSAPLPSAFARGEAAEPKRDADLFAVLERLPVGVLIHRGEQLVYANHALLEWTGYADLAALTEAGGLERLLLEPQAGALDRVNGTGKTFRIAARNGTLTCEGRHYTVPWQGESALMLVLLRTAADERLRDAEIALRASDSEVRELKAILDTATDGVIVVDRDGLILTFNRSAEALFGYDYSEIARRPFTELFAPESERAARDYLDRLTADSVASVLNDGREVIGRVRQGGLIPLFMTMGRIGDGMPKLCAVLRDITQWKRAEEDLLNAKRTAERASSAKSDFLAKISHEIRTPLNAILGFSEVMMGEQFGPIGGERYREYLRDIHASGEHLVSLLNDLLDLSKIEAGKLDLVFASVNLNQLVQQCVALMQPQANQSRIIIRSSLSPSLPPVMADARSVRQIVLNLLSNSIKFTGPGGQVIVSTALTERSEAVLRVRDTGVGMTDKEIETAMEPFRQLATSTRWGSGGTGLGLPLTKALAEANRAAFAIKSARDAGTLVEITFPGTRVAAE